MELFKRGHIYNRRQDLHDKFGGQRQGGISTPSNHPFIMLFTGETGEAHGYRDGWTSNGKFSYTGEGQYGDMIFIRGNKAIRDHAVNGKELHLFKILGKGQVEYVGEMRCTDHKVAVGEDTDKRERQKIVFELTPVGWEG